MYIKNLLFLSEIEDLVIQGSQIKDPDSRIKFHNGQIVKVKGVLHNKAEYLNLSQTSRMYV